MTTGGEDEEEPAELRSGATGETLSLANEFAEVEVSVVRTRNGTRLLISAPRTGRWITLCPLELESLTWQTPATFSAMIGTPFAPLFRDDPPEDEADG